MITAVDTSVLLDIFLPDPTFGPSSRELLRQCLREGRVVACDAVFAEVAAAFDCAEDASKAMSQLPVEFDALDVGAALLASDAHREYRRRGGKRERVIADLLIGAHARQHADRLATRDRGFHRTYFPDLSIVDPSRQAPERQSV